MSQITCCDVCKEFIKQGDKKCLISMNITSESTKEAKEEDYKDMLLSVFCEMQNPNRNIPLYEVCGKCLEVFNHFINIRKEELDRTKEEMRKIFVKKEKKPKETK